MWTFPACMLPSNKLTMQSISLSFCILGLVVASVTAENNSTTQNSTGFDSNGNYSTTVKPLNTTDNVTRTTNNTTDTSTTTLNITGGNSTIPPSTTKQTRREGSTKEPKGTAPSITTPIPIDPSKSPTSAAKTTSKSTTDKPNDASTGDITGIVILVVIIFIAFVCGAACYFARKRARRYSVDFTSRPDEANIPLSTVEPELPVDTVSQNGLQTFESTETTTKKEQEPEAKPEVQEEQKAEADKSVVDASAESAAPAPSPNSKEDVVEQSPPAPVEPSVEEKTDDEGVVSNKTSVESLKETNENNSNNADFSQKRD
ncbi:cell wall protein RTB1 isoform X2 [Etheostoma spectabile]|nr:cell wall protein RTB1-like isoform X2 [Etheostoma spectabile]